MAMASSLSSTCAATTLGGIQDKVMCLSSTSSSSSSSSSPSSPPSTSTGMSSLSYRREVMGTALLFHQNQNALIFSEGSSLSHHHHHHHSQRKLVIEAAKRVDNKRTYVLSSTLKAREGEYERVSKLCHEIRDWALRKKTDKSLGVKQFECYTDLYEKNVIHFMEEYWSVLHMNDFRASPEHVKFYNDVRPLLEEPIALAAYEQRDGQIGFMLNPIGPKGEGGLDDATGQAGKGGDKYMKPKAKKRRGIEFESKARNAMQEISEEGSEKAALQSVPENVEGKSNWSFEKILAKVIGLDSDDADSNLDSAPVKEEQWSLKSLFEKKK